MWCGHPGMGEPRPRTLHPAKAGHGHRAQPRAGMGKAGRLLLPSTRQKQWAAPGTGGFTGRPDASPGRLGLHPEPLAVVSGKGCAGGGWLLPLLPSPTTSALCLGSD